MTWKPNSSIDIAIARARMLASIRTFFDERSVLEVSTPALSRHTATDPNIESIAVQRTNQKLYLQPSPEHFMKRLLAAGYADIYQICHVYRDGESGSRHLPEFTMLEWYRREFGLSAIIAETVALVLQLVAKRLKDEPPTRISYCDAFENVLSLDPLTADIAMLADAVDADEPLKESVGDDRDAWLDLVMASRIAPTFAVDRLTAVYHYPRTQSALARICPDDDRVADRFELYCGSVELANGFVELTDADEQRARFKTDQEKRSATGRMSIEIDEHLIDALRAGLPQSAGVAIGIDRLLMINESQDDIHSVVTFTPGS